MGAETTGLQLNVLTHLGHRLPGATSPQKAAAEMVRTLVRLGVAAAVSTVEADQALVIAVAAPRAADTQRILPSAAGLVGQRIPIDRFPW